jgi:hypothetical protein
MDISIDIRSNGFNGLTISMCIMVIIYLLGMAFCDVSSVGKSRIKDECVNG